MNTESKLREIEERIRNCRRCELWKYRKNAVPGEGNPKAKVMFIGEAPGRNEDEQGRPFVGKAGKLLDEIIEFWGFRREEVYITNVLKCRPPNNRDPREEEIRACSIYLDEQLKIINPKVIVCVGRFAMRWIFEKFGIPPKSITAVSGECIEKNTLFGKKYIMVIYHPAAALWRGDMKERLWESARRLKGKFEELRRIGEL